jgi:hypothetical protein
MWTLVSPTRSIGIDTPPPSGDGPERVGSDPGRRHHHARSVVDRRSTATGPALTAGRRSSPAGRCEQPYEKVSTELTRLRNVVAVKKKPLLATRASDCCVRSHAHWGRVISAGTARRTKKGHAGTKHCKARVARRRAAVTGLFGQPLTARCSGTRRRCRSATTRTSGAGKTTRAALLVVEPQPGLIGQ